jgi:adenylate cyclase
VGARAAMIEDFSISGPLSPTRSQADVPGSRAPHAYGERSALAFGLLWGAPRPPAMWLDVGVEIERKFLVPELPPALEQSQATRIEQGYLAIASDGTEVRVRRRDGETLLTVKGGAGRSRTEEEIVIDAGRFARLWPLTEGRRLEKTRYLIPAEDLNIELDVFSGALTGLVVAEVEFASEEAADVFEPPAWFGAEVTDDARFKNQCLASEGAPTNLRGV